MSKKWKKMNNSEIKNELLLILKEFINFCNTNNLRYSLDGGTLIGAVRHGGFIPWDDDIDVMMPREDYNKFMELYNNESFFTLDSKKNKFYHLPIGKLISKNTKGYEKKYKRYRKYGVYIDIFPLDYIPESEQIFYEKIFYNKKICDKCSIMASKYFYSNNYPINKIDYLKNILLIPYSIIKTILFRNIIGFNILLKKVYDKPKRTPLNKSIIKSNDIKISDTKLSFMCWADVTYNMAFDIIDFDKMKTIKFENLNCNVIKNYKEYLSDFYGDYMKLPPKEEQIPKHNSVFFKKIS